jgi:predicted small lipoprotein YifL
MKNLFQLLLALMTILSLALGGCSDDDNPPPTNPDGQVDGGKKDAGPTQEGGVGDKGTKDAGDQGLSIG